MRRASSLSISWSLPRQLLLAAPLLGAVGCASGGGAKPNDDVQMVRALPPDAAPPPEADGMPPGFRAAFAAADARARVIVYHQQCSATVLRLRATGIFGAAAQAPRAVYCERTADGLPVGGVYDIDSAFTITRRLTLVRLDGARPKYLETIDTARLARNAKLVRDVTREVLAGMRRQGRTFVVVPFATEVGVAEAWVVPVASAVRSAVLGGDVAYVRAADGSLQRVVDRAATWRVVSVPASGVVTLNSAEREVAAVGDVTVARGLAERGRDVALRTAVATSSLVRGADPSGSRFTWEHARKAP